MHSGLTKLMSSIAGVDRRAAVWSACQCTRTVLHLASDERPSVWIEAAEAWVRGELEAREVLPYAHFVDNVAHGADAAAAAAAFGDIDSSGASARGAVAMSSDLVHIAALGYSDGDECFGYGVIPFVAWRRAIARRRMELRRLVSALPWEMTTPTLDQIHAARPDVQVAWDMLTGVQRAQTIADLLLARDRARRSGLDWDDPVHRAVTERDLDGTVIARSLG